jgi:adenosine deaminase
MRAAEADHGVQCRMIAGINREEGPAKGVVFTVIPLTAVFPSLAPGDWLAHGLDPSAPAIKTMAERGLRIMLNSDDPGMLNFSRLQNYNVAADVVGFTPSDFKQFALIGIAGSWLDDSTKRRWTKDWSEEIDGLIAQLEN